MQKLHWKKTYNKSKSFSLTIYFIQKPVLGIKGVSPLARLNSFDLSRSVGIDYMHCVLEGVVKRLLDLWFQPSEEIYCISLFADAVEKRLEQINPPEIVTRLPNTIMKRKQWKGDIQLFLVLLLNFIYT